MEISVEEMNELFGDDDSEPQSFYGFDIEGEENSSSEDEDQAQDEVDLGENPRDA